MPLFDNLDKRMCTLARLAKACRGTSPTVALPRLRRQLASLRVDNNYRYVTILNQSYGSIPLDILKQSVLFSA